jgi:hypothetical protein
MADIFTILLFSDPLLVCGLGPKCRIRFYIQHQQEHELQGCGSDAAELVSVTEGVLKLYGIYSLRVREKDSHVVIKTDA